MDPGIQPVAGTAATKGYDQQKTIMSDNRHPRSRIRPEAARPPRADDGSTQWLT
jgi:hypothetical protein